ncbi:MAG: tetratricopeptide repeat protein [Gemmatimonadales bacterium]
MAHTPELEKLERRYDEDPAKWFAQLAEAYRKYQRVEDAIVILNNHLADRPNYVSALIVLGRCHLDLKADPEAQVAFERVLAIDPENIIALKVMGEIAERAGNTDDARTWLTRLLEVDPSNDEARDALEGMGGAAAADAEPETEAAPSVSFGDIAESFEPTALAEEPAPPPAPGGLVIERASEDEAIPATIEMAAITLDPPVAAPELEPVWEAEPEPEPIADHSLDLAPALDGAPAYAAPMDEAPAEAPMERGELELANFDDPGVAPTEGLEPTIGADIGGRGSLAGLPVILPPDEEEAVDEVRGEPEPVVTETMAELYAQQGLMEEARATYQELLSERPGDARLSARLAALDPAPVAAAVNRFAAAETGGVTARSFLQAVLEGRYAPAPITTPASPAPTMDEAYTEEPPPPSGTPTRPASTAYNLGAVFGEESPAPDPSTPSGGVEGGQKGQGKGGFSFDEFFGGGKPAAPPPGSGEGGEDDSFKSWLKGLKT